MYFTLPEHVTVCGQWCGRLQQGVGRHKLDDARLP